MVDQEPVVDALELVVVAPAQSMIILLRPPNMFFFVHFRIYSWYMWFITKIYTICEKRLFILFSAESVYNIIILLSYYNKKKKL